MTYGQLLDNEKTGVETVEDTQDGEIAAKPMRALPSSWYRSDAMFELERRAVMSQKWILVSHRLRFQTAGDYLKVEVAGYPVFLIKDRQGDIYAHHNVCRHRAHPLVQQDSGKLAALSCAYHGWSYSYDGKLAKAPQYQEFSSFNKDTNGLFKIHVHTDRMGFIWVNLDSKEVPSSAWDDEFGPSHDQHPRFEQFDPKDFHFSHQWSMTCNFNWKTFGDNYNECYHCPTGHPCLTTVSDFSKYNVKTERGHIQHYNVDREGAAEKDKHGVKSTFYFPSAATSIAPDLFYTIRCVPLSASKTRLEYEVYRHNTTSDEMYDRIHDLFHTVQMEDKELCEASQRNLHIGVYTSGELHTRMEEGPVYFQSLVRKLVTEHRHKEELEGQEIWPACPKHSVVTEDLDDISFCQKLDDSRKSELDW